MKKHFFILSALLLFSFFSFADPAHNVNEIRLENGLTVFTLEDYSSPLIRIEFVTKAGFSAQNAKNAGFYTLYTRILSANLRGISNVEAECNSDSSRYSMTVTPGNLLRTLEKLSKTAFSPNFTDESIQNELSKLKNEVLENEKSVGGYINAAIDSRVFSGAPWKHDSGIYPALFSLIDFDQARITLNEISEKYYTPQNSALFISGNIESAKIRKLLDLTFGIYYSATGLPSERPVKNTNQQRKFVIHHPEITDEMTQIVMQYTSLSPEQCDLAANFLNNDLSHLKGNLLKENSLQILGNEYIDAASARKKDSNRLIIQSLMQRDKKATPYEQVRLFVNTTTNYLTNIYTDELVHSKINLNANTGFISENSATFMNQLASYWIIKEYDNFSPEDLASSYINSVTTAAMMTRNRKLNAVTLESLDDAFENEKPYVFVIMNTKLYEKNKKEFGANNYEEISIENGSWYSQELFKRIAQDALDKFNTQTAIQNQNISELTNNSFYQKNKNTIISTKLYNNIPVYVKQNPNSTSTTILLHIEGGKIRTSDNNGFEALMTEMLATNIRAQLNNKKNHDLITGNISVTSDTDISYSWIAVECDAIDFNQCVNAIRNAITDPINMPAIADRIVSNLQYKKRLMNGDAESQMIAQTIKYLYGKNYIASIFEAEKEILQNVSFDEIVENYSYFSDCDRYAFILTGSVPNNYMEQLNADFRDLKPQDFKLIPIEVPDNPSKSQISVKLNHTFLTDVPASKAGKMPAKLIPTTEFVDPVIYIFKTPNDKKDSYLCSAFASYLKENLPGLVDKKGLINQLPSKSKKESKTEFVPKNCTIRLSTPSYNIPFIGMVFRNVARPYEIENLYTNEIQEILLKLTSTQDITRTLGEIKSCWFADYFGECGNNTGLAMLIQDNIDFLQQEKNPEEYLNAFKTVQDASASDFIRIINDYFGKPSLMVYSSDSKK